MIGLSVEKTMDGADVSVDTLNTEVGSPGAEIQKFVRARVAKLQEMFLSDRNHSSAAGSLAMLRRAISEPPGATPAVWGVEFEGMPKSLAGWRDEPSAGEWAVHAALTLYAVHQQSNSARMHQVGEEYSLGGSVRRMVLENPTRYASLEEGQLPRRLSAMVTAESMEEILHYARQIVRMLRVSAIPLDYGRLARDLFDVQSLDRVNSVRLRWGRGYARRQLESASLEEKQKS